MMITDEDEQWYRDYLGDQFAAAFRERSDHKVAGEIRTLLQDLPAAEYRKIIDHVARLTLAGLALRMGLRTGERVKADIDAETEDLSKALELARKEIVRFMEGNETLIKSSVTVWAIDEALGKRAARQARSAH